MANIALTDKDEVEICMEENEDVSVPVPEFDIVTQSMIEEEKRLHDEEAVVEKDSANKFAAISAEERVERLTLLLQKSQVYADTLLKMIEQKKEAQRKKALKREKMLQKKKQKTGKENCMQNSNKDSGASTGSTAKKRQRSTDLEKKNPSKRIRIGTLKVSSEEQEILRNKLYLPKPDDIVSQIVLKDGVRYFGAEAVNVSQPVLFTGGVLREYQILGYQWLKALFSNAINGILADEMGLGKTIQCIAIICHIVKIGFKGPFLVCAPLSTIANWVNEFKTFAPSLPFLLYHGSATERAMLARHINDVSECSRSHPVVITSYEILMKDRMILGRHNWEYMILDEGHRIKNTNCKLLHELKQLRVGAKLLLTGTPLQNNLKELWSLLNFIIPEVFDDLQIFESWFDFGDSNIRGRTELSYEQEKKFLTSLYEILTPFLLRRVKADVKLNLPPKAEITVYAPLTEKQDELYQAAINKTIRNLFSKDSEESSLIFPESELSDNESRLTRSVTKDVRVSIARQKDRSYPEDTRDLNISLNNIMMLLRKCCNHPYLIDYPLIPGTDIYKVDEDLILASGKLMILDRMLQKLKERGHKVLIFSQMTKMLDILEDYMKFRSHMCVRLDGATKLEERQKYIKEFNSNQNLFAFLLSTRAGGLGINLTAADTVIIYDSDWNPQNDLQAQDRCHRIGQTRPVLIYRLVTAESVDQTMVERAANKRKLEKMIMHKNKFKGNLEVELKEKISIGRNEIMRMLQSYSNKTFDAKKAMSDENLEKILDRSCLIEKSASESSSSTSC